MNYIVLDMEWNRPLSRTRKIKYPVMLNGEIIEIGAVKMDESLTFVDQFDVMISPKFYKTMNKAVHEVTLISNEDIGNGVPFEQAISEFKSWCGDEYIFLTWGPSDMNILWKNLTVYGLKSDWLPESFDAQLMFDDQVTMECRQFALSYAIWKLGIKPYPAHKAVNDALNTAEIIKKLDMMNWMAEERQYRNEEADCI